MHTVKSETRQSGQKKNASWIEVDSDLQAEVQVQLLCTAALVRNSKHTGYGKQSERMWYIPCELTAPSLRFIVKSMMCCMALYANITLICIACSGMCFAERMCTC